MALLKQFSHELANGVLHVTRRLSTKYTNSSTDATTHEDAPKYGHDGCINGPIGSCNRYKRLPQRLFDGTGALDA
jgi:hypothetical protein